MQNVTQTFIASASSIQSSDLYMTIETPMFSSPTPNLNGVRVTEAFIDELVDNQAQYVGLPLVADVQNLEARKFDRLGHKYDQRTNTFGTSIIGSFYEFKKEVRANGEIYLVGYARVMKRNKKTCAAIAELFAQGGLKFSFEISCGSYKKLQDGTIEIDADQCNKWEGMAIVSMPAFEDAVAYQLVAEESEGKEAEPMNKKPAAEEVEETIETAEEVVEEKPTKKPTRAKAKAAEVQEEIPAEAQEEVPEVRAEEQEDNTVNEVVVAETAEVYVTEIREEKQVVHVEDTETGMSTCHVETVEDRISGPVQAEEIPAENAEQAVETAEDDSDPENHISSEEKPVVADDEPPAPVEEVPPEPEEDEEHRFVNEIMQQLAAIRAENEALRNEMAELRERISTEPAVETVNPFMADISVDSQAGYRLLQETKVTDYTLL